MDRGRLPVLKSVYLQSKQGGALTGSIGDGVLGERPWGLLPVAKLKTSLYTRSRTAGQLSLFFE